MGRDIAGRPIVHLLVFGLGLAALGCGDSSRGSSPTSPEFAPSTTSCDLSTARGLVSSIFPASVRSDVNALLQTIQNAGPQTAGATNAGFDLLALLATYGPSSPQNGSVFANAIISCQDVGPVSLPIDFSAALGPNGAFEVRGGSSTDKAAAVSHDGVWGLEPPLNTTETPPVRYLWDQITVSPIRFSPPSNPLNDRFLAYGAPITDPNFTAEHQVGTIFDWFTIPRLSFTPGAVVGTCLIDGGANYLIQHNSQANQGEIVPSATPSFCPASTSLRPAKGWGPSALARRVLDLFRPEPLLAVALGPRPPGGSIGSLSPSVAVDPGLISLAFQGVVADGRTNQVLKFTNGNFVSVSVTPAGLTKMDGVLVQLTAATNLGTPVVTTGNLAATEDGVATFPSLKISKAGGYRLIATIAAFGQNNTAGFESNSISSNGFNLKQTK